MAMPVPPGLEEEGTERAPNYLSSTVRNAGRNPKRGRRGKSRSYELDPANRVYAFRFGEARGEPMNAWIKDLAAEQDTTSGAVALALLEHAKGMHERGEIGLKWEAGKLSVISA